MSSYPNQDKRPCKGCSADVQVTNKQIQRILHSLNAHPEQCVDDEIYEQRMTACRACPSLAYDTTCMHCGCFVAVRAKFIEKGCPHPGHPVW
jgi:hypothetical protein